MILRKLIVGSTAAVLLISAYPLTAFADGPVSAYDGEQDLSLSPNERVVSESLANDDGAIEDPRQPMSPTARAFRNGLINGRAMQKDEDAKAVPSLPPLPPKGYAGYPAAAQVQAIPQVPVRRYVPAPQQYAQQQPQYVQQYALPPQPPVVVNLVQPQPQYYDDQYAENEVPAYAPPPPPVYVMPRPVYVTRPIIPPAYLPPSYYGYGRPYPQAYGGGYVNFHRRGWNVGVGW